MKIKAELLATLEKSILRLDTEDRRNRYRNGMFYNSSAVKDLDKRYRWDLLWDSDAYRLFTNNRSINDSHIDTALKRTVKPL